MKTCEIKKICSNKYSAILKISNEFNPPILEKDGNILRLSNVRASIEVSPHHTLYLSPKNKIVNIDSELIYYDEFDISDPKINPWTKFVGRHYFQPDHKDLTLTYEKTDGGYKIIRRAVFKDHILTQEYIIEKNYRIKWGIYIQDLTGKPRMFKISVNRFGLMANEFSGDEFTTDRGTQKIDDKFSGPYIAAMTNVSFGKNGKKIIEDNFNAEMQNGTMLPVEIDRDKKGTLYVIYSFVIRTEPYGTGGIDPYTWSDDSPTLDGVVWHYGEGGYTYWAIDTTATQVNWGFLSVGGLYYSRGYVQWDISDLSALPYTPKISLVKFLYAGQVNSGVNNEIRAQAYAPSTRTSSSKHSDIGSGTLLATSSVFPEVGADKEIDLGANGITTLQTRVTAKDTWYAIGMKLQSETANHPSGFSSAEGSDSPDPTLYVEWYYDPLIKSVGGVDYANIKSVGGVTKGNAKVIGGVTTGEE